ncbi:MAG: glycosyltransferase [Nitrospirae bacterium]|nr:glycosyltransferase [Nitrospirota bacterium]
MRPRIVWVGSCSFKEELRRGFDLTVVSARGPADAPPETCNMTIEGLRRSLGACPDLVVWTDGDLGHLVDLDRCEVPTLCFFHDPHLLATWAEDYATAFDHMATTQRAFVDRVGKAIPGLAEWIPYWADLPEAPLRPAPLAEREIDVAFVGHVKNPNHVHRARFLAEVSERLSARYRLHLGEGDWRSAYARSKIVLNVPVADDVNMRVFEATACGALLVSPAGIAGMDELLGPGVDFVDYPAGSGEQAAARVVQALRNLSASQKMAHNGFLKTVGQHLRTHRGRQVTRMIRQVLRTKIRRDSPAMRGLKMARALVALALDTPMVPASGWNVWFDERLELARERLQNEFGPGPEAGEQAFLGALVGILQGRLEESSAALAQASRDPELEGVARYGASRVFRLIGDLPQANLWYPRGFRSGQLHGKAKRYWGLLWAALNHAVRDYSIRMPDGRVELFRGPARETRISFESSAQGPA